MNFLCYFKSLLVCFWLIFWTGSYQFSFAQASVPADHVSHVAQLAYNDGYFGQAASQFANLLENEKALNDNFYGVLVTRALNEDAKAQAFFMLEALTPAFKAYIAPLSAYFKFKKGILSPEEARVTFNQILQTRPPQALWPQVYLSLFCFELHTQTQVSGAQAKADLLALQQRLRSLAPVISPDLSSIYGYLELLYVFQLGLQGRSELSPVLPVSLQKHDLRFMQRFEEEHSAFVGLETLLVQGSEPPSEKVENEWCILAAFADPNEGNMAALERALKEEVVAQSWINTLTQTWAPWPYDQVLFKHYPDLTKQGKWTLIDVWGTWCGPCRRQLPALQSLFAQQDQQVNPNFQIVTLSYKSTALSHFMQQNAYTFPVEELEKHEEAAMQLKAYPTTWLIAPNGKYVKLSNLEAQLPWLQWLQQQ